MKKALAYMTLCLLSLPALAQETYDLPALLDHALENSYEMKIFRKELALDRSDYERKRKLFLPNVNAYMDYRWYFVDQPEYWFPEEEGSVFRGGSLDGPYAVPLGLPQNLFMGVYISQPLFDYRFTLQKEGQELLEGMENARTRQKMEKIVLDLGHAYYDYHSLQSKRELLDFGIERLETALRISSLRVENELAEPVEVEKIKYELAKLEIQKTELDEGLKLKKKQLLFLAGFSVENDITISSEDPEELSDLGSGESTAQSELLELSGELNELENKQAKSGQMPSLDLYADFGLQSQSEDLNLFNDEAMNNISSLGLKLNIPVYTPDKRTSERAQIEKDILDLQKERLREAENLKLDQEKIKLNSLSDLYEKEKELRDLSERLYKGAMERYEVGLLSIRELQEAGNEFYSASAKMLDTYYQIRKTELDYLENSGHLLEYFNITP